MDIINVPPEDLIESEDYVCPLCFCNSLDEPGGECLACGYVSSERGSILEDEDFYREAKDIWLEEAYTHAHDYLEGEEEDRWI